MKVNIVTTFSILTLLFTTIAQAQSYNGVYENAAKQKLRISNFTTNESFKFEVNWGVNDEWGCMFEAQGLAYIKDQTAFYNEDIESAIQWPLITFDLTKNAISISPSVDFLGSDCIKYGDSGADTYIIFKKIL
jgi:hypothetical protein